jgi:RND family efflux transporter MFP subunit
MTINRFHRRAGLAGALLLTATAAWLLGHEGHAPLPTRGAQVDREHGRIVLSAEARDALDIDTAPIPGDDRSPPEFVAARTTLTAPWSRQAFVSSRLPGRIVALHAQAGQHIEAGQVLAEASSLELETLRLEIRNLRENESRAQEVVKLLRGAEGSVNDSRLVDAEAELRRQQAALDVARAKWSALELSPDDFRSLVEGREIAAVNLPIRSPIAGTIIHSDLDIGKVVESGEHLFEIVDLTTVWARLDILERDLGRIAEGQTVELRLTAFPGEVFMSRLHRIGPELDARTHLNPVWAEFANPKNARPRLVPGLTGQAHVLIPTPSGTRVMPTAALVSDGIDHYVFVEESSAEKASTYVRRNVVVKSDVGKIARVHSNDLFPGDRVVTRGAHELAGFIEPTSLRPSPETAQTIGLKVQPLEAQVVENVMAVPGEIDAAPRRRTVASSRLAGIIAKVHVEIGQPVKAGQVLADIVGMDPLNLQLDLLRERLVSEPLDQQYTALRNLGDAASRRRLLQVESERTTAHNRIESLRRQLKLVGLSDQQLDDLIHRRRVAATIPILAPADGIVASFDRTLGQSIKAEEPIFEIRDDSQPLVRGFAAESELRFLRTGQRARIRLVSNPSNEYRARVVRSSRVLSGAERAVSFWLEFDHDSIPRARLGETARICLTIDSPTAVPALPRGAVIHDGTKSYVFVQKDNGTFDRRTVETGRSDDRFVEITQGAAIGEKIAVSGVADLWTGFNAVK